MANLIIVDIDGTLADCEHRMEHIQKTPRDWDSFYAAAAEDSPHWDVINMVNALSEHYCVILLTGRREEIREITEQWLSAHEVEYHALIMRPVGNRDDDHHWKTEVIRQFGFHNVEFVVEDRNRIVETLRKEGLRVVQVADGPF